MPCFCARGWRLGHSVHHVALCEIVRSWDLLALRNEGSDLARAESMGLIHYHTHKTALAHGGLIALLLNSGRIGAIPPHYKRIHIVLQRTRPTHARPRRVLCK